MGLALIGGLCSCRKAPDTPPPVSQHHHHHPPHQGTPIELGREEYHIELVVDEASGNLQAYVLDGEMENFVRCQAPAIEIRTTTGGIERTIVLEAVANPETGETVGDTALYQARADWVKAAGSFEGILRAITIRGSTYTDVRFSFPRGNDTDG